MLRYRVLIEQHEDEVFLVECPAFPQRDVECPNRTHGTRSTLIDR